MSENTLPETVETDRRHHTDVLVRSLPEAVKDYCHLLDEIGKVLEEAIRRQQVDLEANPGSEPGPLTLPLTPYLSEALREHRQRLALEAATGEETDGNVESPVEPLE